MFVTTLAMAVILLALNAPPTPVPAPDDGYVSKVEAIIERPAHKIDLTRWILNLTDLEYIACSKDHIAMGVTKDEQGQPMLINAERTIEGLYMIHHYKLVVAEKNRVVAKSEKTLFIDKTPFVMPITWELRVTPNGEQSTLACEVTVAGFAGLLPKEMPDADKQAIMAHSKANTDAHNAEETPNFARSIESKGK